MLSEANLMATLNYVRSCDSVTLADYDFPFSRALLFENGIWTVSLSRWNSDFLVSLGCSSS